jgi:protein TonB
MNHDIDPDLARAAVEAVNQWRYQPTLLNGNPIEIDTTIMVNFKLQP